MGDKLKDRVPLSYLHLVTLMVDFTLLLTPFACLAEMGNLSPLATFVVTIFFQGLLDLSKLFIDPFNNENGPCHGDSLNVDVLIQETTRSSTGYFKSVETLPAALR